MPQTEPPTQENSLILAIDPSIQSLGYALGATGKKNPTFFEAGVIKISSRHAKYHVRGLHMAMNIIHILPPTSTVDVVIETQTNWFTHRGMASKDNEAIQKLYYTTGCLVTHLAICPSVRRIFGVSPNQWKGQLPKKVMIDRATHLLELQNKRLIPQTPHDTYEAVMILEYANQHLNTKNQNKKLELIHERNIGATQFVPVEVAGMLTDMAGTSG